MTKGKQTCKILKQIRTQIAAKNDIEYITSECNFKGECAGTCPKCEEEVRYLENELRRRQQLGKVVTIAGISLGVVGTCAAQTPMNDTIINSVDNRKIETVGSQIGSIEVSGKLTDTAGRGLIGATVYEKGTKNGTIVWDDDGSWSLNVKSPETVLVFELATYYTQERTVGSERNFVVQMKPDENIKFANIVMTGYASPRLVDVVGSITKIKKLKKKNKQKKTTIKPATIQQ
ncbi:MAG: carboxypeptidase-like regulatory domain-containing protein [Bacteroidetes bacterium]|nr:carboxypeptidase-like regulatory domain-containing protein [Bacteroidota bacterium]